MTWSLQVTILLELRYRSPLEGNEDSDEDVDDEEDEEFIPNVGLVSTSQRRRLSREQEKAAEANGSTGALIALEENIAKLEQSILSSNNNHATGHAGVSGAAAEPPQVRFSSGLGGGGHRRASSSQQNRESQIRRSTSLNEDTEVSFGQKKKRTFNFTNLKKRWDKFEQKLELYYSEHCSVLLSK